MVREAHLRSSSPLYLLQPEAPWKGFSEPALQDPSSNSFPSMPSYHCISKSCTLTVCPSVPCSSLRHLYLRTTFSLAFPALSESPALAGLCSSAYTPTPQGRGTLPLPIGLTQSCRDGWLPAETPTSSFLSTSLSSATEVCRSNEHILKVK